MSIVSYQLDKNIGVIRIDNPPVNALSQSVRKGINDAVSAAQSDASEAIIIICEGRTFIAGADIKEFGQPLLVPTLPEVIQTIESSSKPVVAAIHGTALGGGFEISLSCHYRCALTSAKVGLPEVKLGLLPGAGGTQRVPRLAGIEAALDMMTSGNPVSAKQAMSMGLIDRITEDDLFSTALAYARELVASNAEPKRIRDVVIDRSSLPDNFFDDYRAKLARRTRGQIAPQHIISCVEAAVNQPFDEGIAKERALFLECMKSPQSAAMRHMFFAEREATKVKGLSKDAPVRDIKSVGIIGGGTMGGGIAMNFANAGIPVVLLEITPEALQRGLDIVAGNYRRTVAKGKLSENDATQRQTLITGTLDYQDLADVDLVIEAVFENLDLKKEVFGKLDAVCKSGTILASNTSYQDVDAIAASISRPQDVLGLHFFSPANVMKLLEVVRGEKTADDVIATVMSMAKTIQKVPVLSGVCYGFIGNRMLREYWREAQLCLIEGSTPEAIDQVMVDWGMAMGPLSVGDLAGLDIGYKARQALSDEQREPAVTYCVPDALVEMGRLGQKSGAGYYLYDQETRARSTDPLVQTVIEEQAQKHGIVRKPIIDETILNRQLLALINEGFKILEEGIAQRPGDIDVVYVFGYGFPAYRGGPMFYADTMGLKKVYESICEYRELYGEEKWRPAALLEELVRDDKTLGQWAVEQGQKDN